MLYSSVRTTSSEKFLASHSFASPGTCFGAYEKQYLLSSNRNFTVLEAPPQFHFSKLLCVTVSFALYSSIDLPELRL
jgi:hypothetical protein